ncbi:MAG: metallophosphoesterase [Leptospirales bacterium]|nr:metallophosphoesterase [Leptospirales bacterium]
MPRVRFLIFFISALAILSLLYGYAAWHILDLLPQGPWRWLGWVLVALCLVALPLTFLARVLYEANNPGLEGIAWLAYVGLGLFSLLFTFFAIRDLAGLIWHAAAWALPQLQQPGPQGQTWINAAVALAALLLFAFGFFTARRDPVVRRIRVSFANLHPDLVGMRLVQLSDIHIGPTIKRPFIERLVKRVNALECDGIAITGDLVDGSVKDLLADALPLQDLTHRPVFFVTGNHEYYSGALQWLAALEKMGIRVLVNAHEILQRGNARVVMAGVADITAHQMIPHHLSDPFKALSGARGELRVLLAHQPRSVFAAAEAGADLVLSGHTHAGQYFPGTLIVRLVQPFVVGLGRFRDTQVYTSPGTGYWGPPLRLGTRAEITILEFAST